MMYPLIEAVLLSFAIGGILGAVVALSLTSKRSEQNAKKTKENPIYPEQAVVYIKEERPRKHR